MKRRGGNKPLIMVVEDDAALREALSDILEINGYAVLLADCAEAALVQLKQGVPGLLLSDVQMPGLDGHALLRSVKQVHPGLPVVLMTAYGQIEKAVQAMREGAADYLPKPFEPERLLSTVARHYLQPPATTDAAMVAEDPSSRDLLALAQRVAASEATVLLTGESGVGKEVLARYIHQCSSRARGPFVAVNCAAIPDNLLEATLFGHEKGAFTGATSAQPGKFELARGGVILLDELAELPITLQAKLLRALQEREVDRVGGRSSVSLDVRVLAATNRNLSELVEQGLFREDLYYRINVFPLEIPPLRSRKADILPLAYRFLEQFGDSAGRAGIGLSGKAQAALTGYEWPGNIRELGNVLQRAMILAPGQMIEVEHLMLPAGSGRRSMGPMTGQPTVKPAGSTIKDLERDTILGTLDRCRGSRKKTAEALGMSERTLRYKLQRYRENGELDGDSLL